MCVSLRVCMCYSMYMKVRGQLGSVPIIHLVEAGLSYFCHRVLLCSLLGSFPVSATLAVLLL